MIPLQCAYLRPRFLTYHPVQFSGSTSVIEFTEDESLEFFISGKSVFMRNWASVWSAIEDSNLKGKVGVVPLPKGEKVKNNVSILGGSGIAISRFGSHTQKSRQFAEFLTNKKQQLLRNKEGNYIPTRLDVWTITLFSRSVSAQHIEDNILRTIRLRPTMYTKDKYFQISNTFAEAVNDILSGKDVEREISRLNEKIQWTLDVDLEGDKNQPN